MSITSELRKEAQGHLRYLYTSGQAKHLLAIADRIDAGHAEVVAKSDRQREQLAAMEDALRRRNEGELKRRWQREIDALRDERDELREAVRLSEAKASDMVELPKDADGKVIRMGDILDNTHKDGFAAKAVIGISYHPGGKVYVEVENRLRWHDPGRLRHHRATVEDVLASYGGAAIELHHEHKNGEMGFEEYHAAMDRLAALYATRLRLAESEGE